VLAVPSRPAYAQLGGFLKKKAMEAAEAPVQQQQAKQRSTEQAAAALRNPDVVPITQESTDRFMKALGVEIRLRNEFRSMLASMKSREEYEACKGEIAMSPEGMQIAMGLANISDKATPAEMQKAMMKMGADMEALTLKRCGGDPSGWPDHKRAERLRQIERRASRAFAPTGGTDSVGEGFAGADPHGPAWFPPEPVQTEDVEFYRPYGIAKERWIAFCSSGAEMKTEGDFVYVKGMGDVWYVFTKEEAEFMTRHCSEVMAEIKKTTEPVQGAK
jgi:hypothetical protein